MSPRFSSKRRGAISKIKRDKDGVKVKREMTIRKLSNALKLVMVIPLLIPYDVICVWIGSMQHALKYTTSALSERGSVVHVERYHIRCPL